MTQITDGQAVVDRVQKVKEVTVDKLNADTSNSIFDGGDNGNLMELDVQSGVNPTIWSKTLDYEQEPMAGEAMIPSDDPVWEYGDRFSFGIYPPSDGLIGTFAADAAADQPEMYGTATVLQSLKPGFHLKLGDDTNGWKEYRVKAVDYDTGKITLYENLAFARTTGDFVKLRVYSMRHWPVWRGVVQRFGDMTPGAKNIPAGWTMMLVYDHKTDPTQAVTWIFGLVYDY